MTAATMVLPARRRRHRRMPQQPKLVKERIGFTIPNVVIIQSHAMFEARNEDRVEMILRIMRAYTAGTWEPNPTTALPSEGQRGKIQLNLRPQDTTPYRDKCAREHLPISFPIAHGLWIYAHEPDPAKLPF